MNLKTTQAGACKIFNLASNNSAPVDVVLLLVAVFLTMIAGILYSCQFLILTADQPTLAENLMIESGYSMAEFLAEQKKTGHESEKIELIIRESFRRQSLKSRPKCPECLMATTADELNMFGGLCEECTSF